jgi:hypothetical protein
VYLNDTLPVGIGASYTRQAAMFARVGTWQAVDFTANRLDDLQLTQANKAALSAHSARDEGRSGDLG